MMVTCRRCGTANPDDARFCSRCGEALNAPAATPRAAQVSGKAPGPVKKKATPLQMGCGCLVVGIVILIVLGVAASALNGTGGGVPGGGGGIGSSDFTIRVTGTNGTVFSGAYDVVTLTGSSASKSVAGAVPADYRVSGSLVSVTFQKQSGGSDVLKVELLKGGNVIKEADTTAPYGTVAVASQ